MNLSTLKTKKLALVERIEIGRHGKNLVYRLEAMGIVPNKSVMILRQAGFGGPLHVRVGLTTEVAIRREEARMILIKPL